MLTLSNQFFIENSDTVISYMWYPHDVTVVPNTLHNANQKFGFIHQNFGSRLTGSVEDPSHHLI